MNPDVTNNDRPIFTVGCQVLGIGVVEQGEVEPVSIDGIAGKGEVDAVEEEGGGGSSKDT